MTPEPAEWVTQSVTGAVESSDPFANVGFCVSFRMFTECTYTNGRQLAIPHTVTDTAVAVKRTPPACKLPKKATEIVCFHCFACLYFVANPNRI